MNAEPMHPFHLESNGSERTLRLSGEVTIEHARDLHAVLLAAVPAGSTLRIDARNVSRLDAAIVQVLLSAVRATTHTETAGASAAWTQAFQRFGISSPALSSPCVP